MRTAENGVEWRCIDEEHDKSASRKDPDEVVLVADYIFPERKTDSCLDSKDLFKAVGGCQRGQKNSTLTLKHWVKKIDKYTTCNSCHLGSLGYTDRTYQ